MRRLDQLQVGIDLAGGGRGRQLDPVRRRRLRLGGRARRRGHRQRCGHRVGRRGCPRLRCRGCGGLAGARRRAARRRRDADQSGVQLLDPLLDLEQVLPREVGGGIGRRAQLADLLLQLAVAPRDPLGLGLGRAQRRAQALGLGQQLLDPALRHIALVLGLAELGPERGDLLVEARALALGALHRRLQLGEPAFGRGARARGDLELLPGVIELLPKARDLAGRLARRGAEPLDLDGQVLLRLARLELDRLARGLGAGEAGVELRVLPAQRHQLLLDPLRLAGRILDRLGQLRDAGLGALAGALQLVATGAQGGRLGRQALVLLPDRLELLPRLARVDRDRGGLGQLLEPRPGRGERLVELGERRALLACGRRRGALRGRSCGVVDQDHRRRRPRPRLRRRQRRRLNGVQSRERGAQ